MRPSLGSYNHPMAIPQSFIQELLARTDVVEIVGRYVQLKKGGANFMGLCPFHGEKSPSFSVSPTKQFYHCFGCGKNGNAISFLMDHVGMTFIEAVKDLAQQYGMVHPEEIPIHPKVQPFRPLSTYGVTKVALELLGYQYFYSYGLKTITTRTFNHTGPRQNRQYITADLCAQALEYQLGKRTAIVHGNLDSVRDYTDVRDIVRGYVMAVNLVSSTGIGGMTVQLGGGVVISGHELLARITRILGITNLKAKMAQDRMRPSDVMLLAGDSSIFTMLTGWRPQFTHDQTLRDTLSYWSLRI